ncbi:Gfo/Idh/MocA family protein [Belliella kenyensis]|uniref:Gfo/Idh/MocA family protein n=1 Tax=Belliella kenyensis TaxID=1472724 RepID=A0ABV8EHH7_9BACT|nr:Gfo/Idh/MocA family oxidoreductase [Belliella kenyensis]MCH7401799.1 Gfo/Idh/MocA family oxidoreductase [Belliella kenyensis]MDN3604298.1 Gfo/Idh/MocA family oxidoreductase [Belliella kenyensis]
MNARRKFLQKSLLATAGLSMPSILTAEEFFRNTSRISPNDQINIGLIGCKGMGWSNMSALLKIPEVNCIALADIDSSVLDQRADDVVKARGKKPAIYKDYRKMLENKDIDVVVIGTPDHWHCLNLVDSLDAGKHAYVEKPLANSIEECRIMVDATKKYGKMVQVGQWQRSGSQYSDAIDFVKSGQLGNIRLVKCWAYQGWMNPVPVKNNSPVPNGVDYDMWLGPAPKKPFNENRFHFNFRWFWDYAGGLMTDWGVHEIDIALYAMGVKAPKSVMASGGKLAYPDDASETPDTLQTVYEYDGFNMLWEHATGIDGGNYGYSEGIAFIGNNATLVVNRGGWEVISEKQGDKPKIEAVSRVRPQGNAMDNHMSNFIQAIKNNDANSLNCGVETGSVAAINAHMGNIAYKTGEKIYWDEQKGLFTNKEANKLIKAQYHNGWKLPKI